MLKVILCLKFLVQETNKSILEKSRILKEL